MLLSYRDLTQQTPPPSALSIFFTCFVSKPNSKAQSTSHAWEICHFLASSFVLFFL